MKSAGYYQTVYVYVAHTCIYGYCVQISCDATVHNYIRISQISNPSSSLVISKYNHSSQNVIVVRTNGEGGIDGQNLITAKQHTRKCNTR